MHMMMHRSTNSQAFLGSVAFILRTVLTLLATTILIAQANGYHINFKSLTMGKEGLVVVNVSPSRAVPLLNGVPLHWTAGQWVAEEPPGTYLLTTAMTAYQPWQKKIRVEAGRSIAFPTTKLFLIEPVLTEDRAATAAELQASLVDARAIVHGGELWLNRKTGPLLVSRFSTSIESVLFIDSGHVVFTRSGTAHVIDADGSNDKTLLSAGIKPGTRLLTRSDNELGLLSFRGQIEWYRIQ